MAGPARQRPLRGTGGLPKVIKKAAEIKREKLTARKRREENERKHSVKQFEKRKAERERAILSKLE
ncbi:hypothetical protein QBC45DRAFT_396131 [Copromyces sp. CBS 386.78]|nr:hypothetical protein QBC45DRAFT_396131 [Copromyces sp. CBS 386.78]